MKIKLLNDGGYGDMEDVKFPVEVLASRLYRGGALVSREELYRVGAKSGEFDCLTEFAFVRGPHWELPS